MHTTSLPSRELVTLRASIDVLPDDARRVVIENAVSSSGKGECRRYRLPRHYAEPAQRIAARDAGCVATGDDEVGKRGWAM